CSCARARRAAQPPPAASAVQNGTPFPRLAGLPETTSPIVPLIVGEAEAALAAARQLDDDGFLVVAIRPPTVPVGTARLRFTFTARHPEAEIERLAWVVRRLLPVGAHMREQAST